MRTYAIDRSKDIAFYQMNVENQASARAHLLCGLTVAHGKRRVQDWRLANVAPHVEEDVSFVEQRVDFLRAYESVLRRGAATLTYGDIQVQA